MSFRLFVVCLVYHYALAKQPIFILNNNKSFECTDWSRIWGCGAGESYLANLKTCLFLDPNLSGARSTDLCAMRGMEVLELRSLEQAAMLNKILSKVFERTMNTPVWLGIRVDKKAQTLTYISDGSNVTDDDYNGGLTLGNISGARCVLYMPETKTWRLQPCSAKVARLICEEDISGRKSIRCGQGFTHAIDYRTCIYIYPASPPIKFSTAEEACSSNRMNVLELRSLGKAVKLNNILYLDSPHDMNTPIWLGLRVYTKSRTLTYLTDGSNVTDDAYRGGLTREKISEAECVQYIPETKTWRLQGCTAEDSRVACAKQLSTVSSQPFVIIDYGGDDGGKIEAIRYFDLYCGGNLTFVVNNSIGQREYITPESYIENMFSGENDKRICNLDVIRSCPIAECATPGHAVVGCSAIDLTDSETCSIGSWYCTVDTTIVSVTVPRQDMPARAQSKPIDLQDDESKKHRGISHKVMIVWLIFSVTTGGVGLIGVLASAAAYRSQKKGIMELH